MKFVDYERNGWVKYAAFGEAVATILRAAIKDAGGYRLQQVPSRAKRAKSLRKKLEDRGNKRGVDLIAADGLENEIKDLAGCRIIFYTNNDVTKLINSGLVGANFEILDTKFHHPRPDTDEAAELYISNHYLVRLKPERLALPEYARFAGLRCEIQVQTILNHAWAEMAHDTIYKEPDLEAFGTRALDAIKARMARISRKYLRPAGHEFAKVAADFERLLQGQELFKSHALEAIIDAADNNERADALETFAESVLPLYDDIAPEWPDILDTLIEAVKRARTTPDKPIETPYGALPAKTVVDIVRGATKVIQTYRYLDPPAAFDTLLDLYVDAASEAERKPLLEAAEALAKHSLPVWRRYGPAVQQMLIDKIKPLGDAQRRLALPFLTAMLDAMLGVEVTGTTSTSGTVMFERGAVVASDALSTMRREAIAQLKALYALAADDDERRPILLALRDGTRPPMGSGYGPALIETLMEAAADWIEFEAELVPTMSWELRQREESAVLRHARINRAVPQDLLATPAVAALQTRIETAVGAFRTAIDADAEYAIYKVLVGYDVTFPPAWDNEQFRFQEERAYRDRAVDAMIAEMVPQEASLWRARVQRCAETQSNDLATFPTFHMFLVQAGERQSAIVLGWLDALTPELVRFLPAMLVGLQKANADALTRIIERWIAAGQYLGEIIWFQRSAEFFDEAMLVAALEQAVASDDRGAIAVAMAVAGIRYPAHPGNLIGHVFMPGLTHMAAVNDISWIGRGFGAWYHSEILTALDEEQATQVLSTLVVYPELEHSAAHIVGAIAQSWPQRALDLFAAREALAASDERPDSYDAIPYSLDEKIRSALADHPDVVFATVRAWYDCDPDLFAYRGGRLVSGVFADLAVPLPEYLRTALTNDRDDIGFVLAILNTFQGGEAVEAVVRNAVALIESDDDDLLGAASNALDQSGVVTGEFGYVELYQQRRDRIVVWLDDADERVRAFAAKQRDYLDRAIAAETRRAEERSAARRLEFGEDIADDEP